jgi:16S rRNA (cytosine967-C5)-methyltransferase
LLRIGAAQAWLLETPDHAVVGETVAAAKLWPRAQRATGFLNAVLRKVVADRSAFDDAPVEANWPAWLRTIAIQGFGAKAANTLVAAQTETPDIYLTPKNGDPQALSTRVDGEVIAGYSVRVSGQAIDTIPGYETGDWWVQDVAATLPARLLNAVAEDKILDICAAPGGKTMQLAASGADVTAIDRSKPRLKRLKQNLWRTGFHGTVETVLADATQWRPDTPPDKILLDAPCSALGTLRRNPEGAWIKSPTDVARFSDIQERLLRASLEMLEPGGILIYCVCSPLPHEGVEIVDCVLQDTAAARLPVKPHEIQGFEPSISALGDVLTLPNASFAHDAFYIARLKREI